MALALALSVDAQAGLDRVAAAFARLPQGTARAQRRALKKLSTWLQRQALRAAAQASAIPQKFFQQSLRYHVKVTASGLSVWLGTNPVKAHRLGPVTWRRTMRGARVGRRGFPGAWSWGRGKTGQAIMARRGTARLPLEVKRVTLHDPVFARLQGLQPEARDRFERLLRQELHYALRLEAAP